MRIILVRHYKTQFNVSNHIIGWGDSPQVDNYLEDLEFVEAALQRQGLEPCAIYSSDLGRARQTAEYFAGKFALDGIHTTRQLNEINYGTLCKKSKSWVSEHYPQHKTDPDFVYPQGESFHQMQERSVDFILSLVESAPAEVLLCVVHAGVIRALVSHFLGLDYGIQLKQKISHRYAGVLDFHGTRCHAYDEWGVPSGFVLGGEIKIPFSCN